MSRITQQGAVIHQVSYAPSSLAADTDATILESSDLKNDSLGGLPLYLRFKMKGGGAAADVGGAGDVHCAWFTVKEGNDTLGAAAFKKIVPMPGEAVGTYILPLNVGSSDGGSWSVVITGGPNAHSAANYNAIKAHIQVCVGVVQESWDYDCNFIDANVEDKCDTNNDMVSSICFPWCTHAGSTAQGSFTAYRAGTTGQFNIISQRIYFDDMSVGSTEAQHVVTLSQDATITTLTSADSNWTQGGIIQLVNYFPVAPAGGDNVIALTCRSIGVV